MNIICFIIVWMSMPKCPVKLEYNTCCSSVYFIPAKITKNKHPIFSYLVWLFVMLYRLRLIAFGLCLRLIAFGLCLRPIGLSALLNDPLQLIQPHHKQPAPRRSALIPNSRFKIQLWFCANPFIGRVHQLFQSLLCL